MYSLKVDASAANIPTTFDESAGSLLTTSVAAGKKMSIINETTAALAVFVGPVLAAPTSVLADNRRQAFVPKAPTDGTSGIVFDLTGITSAYRLYLRSDSGSPITTGIVRISIW